MDIFWMLAAMDQLPKCAGIENPAASLLPQESNQYKLTGNASRTGTADAPFCNTSAPIFFYLCVRDSKQPTRLLFIVNPRLQLVGYHRKKEPTTVNRQL